jgi:hypothetical protein
MICKIKFITIALGLQDSCKFAMESKTDFELDCVGSIPTIAYKCLYIHYFRRITGSFPRVLTD